MAWPCLRTACATRLLPLLLLVLSDAAQALDYTYTTNYGTIAITKYTGRGGAVTIPDTLDGLPVTIIGLSAFSDCASLASITIPNRVTSIGGYAFFACYRLTNVTIGSSVTSIGGGAFSQCSSLTNITLSYSVTSIGSSTFSYCSRLTSVTIPDSVTSIGDRAFAFCSSLKSVTIGNKVISIGQEAFFGCDRLAGVYFKGNAPGIDGDAFLFDYYANIYYLAGTKGWGPTFGERPTGLWNPQVQTSDASFGVRTNRFGFNITGASNLVIVVEASADLAHPSWFPVGTNTLTGGSSYFSDPKWTNYPGRFYRVRSP